MRLRRVVPYRIIMPMVKAVKAGIDMTVDNLRRITCGGNVDRVVDALIAAQRADINLVVERAAAIDLAGRNVLEAVQMSVNPKVETPVVAAVVRTASSSGPGKSDRARQYRQAGRRAGEERSSPESPRAS